MATCRSDYNITRARPSKLGGTPAAQVSGGKTLTAEASNELKTHFSFLKKKLFHHLRRKHIGDLFHGALRDALLHEVLKSFLSRPQSALRLSIMSSTISFFVFAITMYLNEQVIPCICLDDDKDTVTTIPVETKASRIHCGKLSPAQQLRLTCGKRRAPPRGGRRPLSQPRFGNGS